ncbi:AAA family ATPase [Chryseoglobus sp. 28M-23]|uniref:AAA family ATPase n=1 Tax=Chryseoglobus sp. 28M-23 TaxID=2772253 RepID=UPI0017473B66|nr:AAA family ATPase [Chryseoglobus sp. 28M-23]QOD94081.1 AAA family ATPase [Chryseoglobus sp. 28M-23]
MRLVKAEFSGFGRLAQGKINLDNKVIAIVGPNEAGKTTLLKALAYIDNGKSLSVTERSRGAQPEVADKHVVVRAQYLLNDDDRAEVANLDLQEPPTSLWLSRTAGPGETATRVEPAPRKATGPLVAALKAVTKSATKKALAELEVGPSTSEDEDGPDERRESFHQRLSDAVQLLRVDSDAPDYLKVAADLNPASWIAEFAEHGISSPIREALEGVDQWLSRKDPTTEVAERLHSRAPDILLFAEEDRTLSSTYTLSEEVVAQPPAALNNVATMAELSLAELWRTISNGDEGARETHIERANQTLQSKFEVAWRQSNITVQLKIERTVLSIRIKQDGSTITQFDERSAGLQMFVALVAFLAVRGQTVPPVLLIDEAETHLHIDAQADLVNTFMRQQQAAKIIYTTHSPACLPPDLGSNIRAVLPDKSNGQRSVVEGSFWHGAAGFSPLMLAMGAGAAAFSTARYVVLAEGASEMLLLPSLIKAAVGLEDLEYQVAPGISETPSAMYPDLDLAGARVAFLVDGDAGGADLRKALIKGGVLATQIVTLGAVTLENLLDADSYRTAVRSLIAEANPRIHNSDIPDLPELPDRSVPWPSVIETCGLTPDFRSVRYESRLVAPLVGEEDWIHHDHEKAPAHAGTDRSQARHR